MSRWRTIECERVLYVDRGKNVITCDRLPSGPVTLVVKLERGEEPTMQAQPGQEQRMELDELHGARVANEERFARQLLARRERDLGFTGYADWLDAGCPPNADHEYPHEKIADICFYVASARTRPTADLGEDGELVDLRAAFDGDSVPAKNIALRQAHDRLILVRRARDQAEQVISAWAFAHNIDGAARNDLFERLRRSSVG